MIHPPAAGEARLSFATLASDGAARVGRLVTRRGEATTPVFMPVGTAGTIKGLLPEEAAGLGATIILANTYHLLLRPGVETVAGLGGLHRMMGWDGPILTDSGGFQVFSLAALRQVDEEGVSFRSHLDGSLLWLSPERAIAAQELLGSDIMMMLDECPPAGAPRQYYEASLARDARWGARALAARTPTGGALFGIVQGGTYPELRARSAELLGGLGFDGLALGGLSVGESKEAMREAIARTVPLLPAGRPVYLMGVGAPEDLVACVGLGVDMFDCVLPTRMARNGTLLTRHGRLNLRNARFAKDPAPVEADCACPVCRRFSRAYLRHLFLARELLAYRLNTVHNLYFVFELMDRLREAIREGRYHAFARRVLAELAEGEGA